MTAEALTAWVLHKQASGDTSARVSFFTQERGRVDCLCKGGRTPKKQALLQPFAVLWLAVDRRRDWFYASHIESQSAPCELKSHALFAALYLNELLYYTLSPLDPQPELYKVYVHTLEALVALTERSAIEILLRRFEWALLIACGHTLSFVEEVNSGKPIRAENYYRFIAGEGFRLAEQGISGSTLIALAQGELDDLYVLKSAKLIMRQAIDFLLEGRELKSRAYARSLALLEREKQ